MANEKRLIDEFKHEVMSEFIRLCRGNDFNKLTLLKIGDTIDRLYEKYSTLPTVDAVEVVHGRWERTYVMGGIEHKYSRFMVKCSVCGWGNVCQYNYCPNCGAKMDGERKRKV